MQVEAGRQGSGHQHLGLIRRQGQPHRVKTLARQHRQSQGLQASHKGRAQAEQAPGDRLQAIGAMVHRIKASHHCQQHLSGADVAGGLVAADVLFAGLQGQAQGRLAFRIQRAPHQAARDLALELLARGEKSGMGTTKTQRHPQALGAADGDISAEVAHRLQQHLGQGIDRHSRDHPGLAGASQQLAGIPEPALAARQLDQQTKSIRWQGGCSQRLGCHQLELDTQGLGPGLQHRQGLGEHGPIHQKAAGPGALADSASHGHGLSGGGGLIQ